MKNFQVILRNFRSVKNGLFLGWLVMLVQCSGSDNRKKQFLEIPETKKGHYYMLYENSQISEVGNYDMQMNFMYELTEGNQLVGIYKYDYSSELGIADAFYNEIVAFNIPRHKTSFKITSPDSVHFDFHAFSSHDSATYVISCCSLRGERIKDRGWVVECKFSTLDGKEHEFKGFFRFGTQEEHTKMWAMPLEHHSKYPFKGNGDTVINQHWSTNFVPNLE